MPRACLVSMDEASFKCCCGVADVCRGLRRRAFCCLWPRGGPSSSAMLAVALLFVFVAAAPANKITHRIHVIEAKACPRAERVRRGDSVDMTLAAATHVDGVDHFSPSAAEQQCIVGRHPVPAVNKALVGMCVGESRKVSLYWDSQPGMQYVLQLRRVRARKAVAADF